MICSVDRQPDAAQERNAWQRIIKSDRREYWLVPACAGQSDRSAVVRSDTDCLVKTAQHGPDQNITQQLHLYSSSFILVTRRLAVSHWAGRVRASSLQTEFLMKYAEQSWGQLAPAAGQRWEIMSAGLSMWQCNAEFSSLITNYLSTAKSFSLMEKIKPLK